MWRKFSNRHQNIIFKLGLVKELNILRIIKVFVLFDFDFCEDDLRVQNLLDSSTAHCYKLLMMLLITEKCRWRCGWWSFFLWGFLSIVRIQLLRHREWPSKIAQRRHFWCGDYLSKNGKAILLDMRIAVETTSTKMRSPSTALVKLRLMVSRLTTTIS